MLCATPRSRRNTGAVGAAAQQQQDEGGGADVLRIDSGDELALGGEDGSSDPFASQMAVPGQAIRLDRRGLAQLKASEVVVRRWPNRHIPCQYFRIMDPDLPLEVAPCGHFFEADELEMVRGPGAQLPGCLPWRRRRACWGGRLRSSQELRRPGRPGLTAAPPCLRDAGRPRARARALLAGQAQRGRGAGVPDGGSAAAAAAAGRHRVEGGGQGSVVFGC
jgi:hypothetical protein